MDTQPGLSHQQVLGRHTDASGMVCMCLARNQPLSCVLADVSQRAELTVGQEGCVSFKLEVSSSFCMSSSAPAEHVGPGWLIFKKIKMCCTVAQMINLQVHPSLHNENYEGN